MTPSDWIGMGRKKRCESALLESACNFGAHFLQTTRPSPCATRPSRFSYASPVPLLEAGHVDDGRARGARERRRDLLAALRADSERGLEQRLRRPSHPGRRPRTERPPGSPRRAQLRGRNAPSKALACCSRVVSQRSCFAGSAVVAFSARTNVRISLPE